MDDLFAFTGENELEFYKKFATNEACMQYLVVRKWKNGFLCPTCGCTEEYFTSKPFHKRCKKCLYHASATANTLFHRLKFGIQKAFVAIFKMTATTKGVSAEQLAKHLGVNRKTALAFQHKVRLATQSSENHPLKGTVEIDEAFVGQEEDEGDGHRGRAADKAQIVVAVEKTGKFGIKRMYARVIENAGAAQLKTIFVKHIATSAKVLTDKWRGYLPFTAKYDIEQEKSNPKENFQVVHRCIQQLKSWLRGIHHSVSHNYLQAYLNEFSYRINRSLHKNTIFDNLINRMIAAKPCYSKLLKNNY